MDQVHLTGTAEVASDGAGSRLEPVGSTQHLADDADRAYADLGARVDTAERSLLNNIPLGLRKGLEEVKRLQDPSHPAHVPGIVGPLYDLFRPNNDRYNTAVEAVAELQLFNVVVRDEKAAAAVVAHLQRARAGRSTSQPLFGRASSGRRSSTSPSG